METFFEVTTARGGRVNRELGIVYDVKILGEHSRNGRRYSRAAMQMAVSKYEGADVYCNHATGSGPRDVNEKAAKIRSVRYIEGELRGNLHLIPGVPFNERVLWAAEHAPDMFGLSHNIIGKSRKEKGGDVVEEITKVNSVDIVSDPATTKGLFEAYHGRTLMESWTDRINPAELQATLASWKS